MYRFAFIIVNYQTPELVIDCITSLASQIDMKQDCVVVVDNLSEDQSATIITQAINKNGWKWVNFVQSSVNAGFSAGNNLGMMAVDAEAYWLTNSDTIFQPNAIAAMQNGLDLHPEAGMISPRLQWPDGRPQINCFRHHSPLSELMDAAKTRPIDAILHRYGVAIPVSDAPIQPAWTSFASVVIRQKCKAEVGLMDEGFFMYYEDADYGHRVYEAGWQIMHWPAAQVIHLRGGTSDVKAKTIARKNGLLIITKLDHVILPNNMEKVACGAPIACGGSAVSLVNPVNWSVIKCHIHAKTKKKIFGQIGVIHFS